MNVQTVVLSFVFGIAGAMSFQLLHNYLYERPIGVVSIDVLINEHLESVADGDAMDDATQESVTSEYARTIESTIRAISENQRVTLLVKPAVLTSAPDYTPLVRQALQQVGEHVP